MMCACPQKLDGTPKKASVRLWPDRLPGAGDGDGDRWLMALKASYYRTPSCSPCLFERSTRSRGEAGRAGGAGAVELRWSASHHPSGCHVSTRTEGRQPHKCVRQADVTAADRDVAVGHRAKGLPEFHAAFPLADTPGHCGDKRELWFAPPRSDIAKPGPGAWLLWFCCSLPDQRTAKKENTRRPRSWQSFLEGRAPFDPHHAQLAKPVKSLMGESSVICSISYRGL